MLLFLLYTLDEILGKKFVEKRFIFMKEFVLSEKLKCLGAERQWVVRRGKIPFSPFAPYVPAKSNTPETWGTLREAQAALQVGSFDGLGFEFGNFPAGTLRVSGIDLDHVIREDGTLEPFAAEIVEIVNSYTEYSPSGTGLHILCRTAIKDVGRKKGINTLSGIEMYNHGRYFTVTGKIYGEARDVAERSEEFLEVYERYFGEETEGEGARVSQSASSANKVTRTKPQDRVSHLERDTSSVLVLTDQDLLEKMFKSRRGIEIERLYRGDWTGYASQSEADLALVSHLMFWTQRDEARVDSLFRQSGLMRPKWDREDYRERTMGMAMMNNTATYSPTYYFPVLPHDMSSIPPIYSDVEDSRRHSEAIGGYLSLRDTTDQSVSVYIGEMLRRDKMEFLKNKSRKTGFENLDRITNLYPGLYVLGAISSLGKTTFACQLADQLSEAGEHVLFFSLEQSRFELVTKGLARLTAKKNMKSALSAMEIREGKMTPELEEAEKDYSKNGKHEIIYECGFDTTVETILDKVKDYMSKNDGVKPVVIVDYLQIVRPLDKRQSTKDGVDSNVRAFKKLQTENELVVLLISSLNRSNYLTPVDFESFKESGGIEYTADVIWGLQLSIMNDEMFDKEKALKTKREAVVEAKKKRPREVELVCLKNRYGISSYKCKFDYYAQYDYFVPRIGKTASNSERMSSQAQREIRF